MTASRLAVVTLAVLLGIGAAGYVAAQTAGPQASPLVVSAPPSAQVPAPLAQAAPQEQRRTAPVVDPAWVTGIVALAGIPEPAVRAYANAQLSAASGCEVGWTTLAGIGWVESQHGTLAGRTLGADGHSDTAIVGPALDGNGVAAIRATAKTSVWHGDPVWDHAVGPMQFLPSTWERWGRDGDGDGVADPNDLDDAARAAMAYLCADGDDLTSGRGWADAVFGYNHDRAYVASVHAAASAYASRTD